ncbi:MAG: hypothetical protein JW936_06915 [Sedimentisphaerales bacterium]|nr:hypothetical protein [Sedimentisphaerales bacterium]
MTELYHKLYALAKGTIMTYLQDPIIAVLFVFCIAMMMVAMLRQKRWGDVVLLGLVVLLFGLPRAGVFIGKANLPLPLAHILAAMLIVIWGLRRYQVEHKQKLHYFFLLYGVMACWGMILGLASGGNLFIAFLESSFYLFSIGLFFYASETFADKHYFRLFVKILAIVAAAVSIYGIAQYFFGPQILLNRVTYNSASDRALAYLEYSGSHRRVLSSYGDPNVLASGALVFLSIGLAIVTARGIVRTKRLVWLTVLILSGICLYFTHSRAAMLCTVIVALIIFCRYTRVGFTVVPLLVVGGILAWISLGEIEFLSGVVPANDMRWKFAGWAWQFVKGVPLGCGFGNSIIIDPTDATEIFSVVPATTIWMGFNSFWLDLLSRLGIPGVLAFILLLMALFRRIWHDTFLVSDPMVRAVLVGGLAGCIGQCVIWTANNTYMLPGGGVNFWFMMGMLYAGCRAFSSKTAVVLLPTEGTWGDIPEPTKNTALA